MNMRKLLLRIFPPKKRPWEPYGDEKRKIGGWIKTAFFGLLAMAFGRALIAYGSDFALLNDLWKMLVIGGTGTFLYLVYEFRHRLGRLVDGWAEKLLPLLGYDTTSVEVMRRTLVRAEEDVSTLNEAVTKLSNAERKLHQAVEQLVRSKEKGTQVDANRILTISHRYKEVKKMRERVSQQRDRLAANVRALRAQREADKTALEATREAEEALAELKLGDSEFTSFRLRDAEESLYYELTKSMSTVEETINDMHDPIEEEQGPSEGDLDELILVLKSEFGFDPADLRSDDSPRQRPRIRE